MSLGAPDKATRLKDGARRLSSCRTINDWLEVCRDSILWGRVRLLCRALSSRRSALCSTPLPSRLGPNSLLCPAKSNGWLTRSGTSLFTLSFTFPGPPFSCIVYLLCCDIEQNGRRLKIHKIRVPLYGSGRQLITPIFLSVMCKALNFLYGCEDRKSTPVGKQARPRPSPSHRT